MGECNTKPLNESATVMTVEEEARIMAWTRGYKGCGSVQRERRLTIPDGGCCTRQRYVTDSSGVKVTVLVTSVVVEEGLRRDFPVGRTTPDIPQQRTWRDRLAFGNESRLSQTLDGDHDKEAQTTTREAFLELKHSEGVYPCIYKVYLGTRDEDTFGQTQNEHAPITRYTENTAFETVVPAVIVTVLATAYVTFYPVLLSFTILSAHGPHVDDINTQRMGQRLPYILSPQLYPVDAQDMFKHTHIPWLLCFEHWGRTFTLAIEPGTNTFAPLPLKLDLYTHRCGVSCRVGGKIAICFTSRTNEQAWTHIIMNVSAQIIPLAGGPVALRPKSHMQENCPLALTIRNLFPGPLSPLALLVLVLVIDRMGPSLRATASSLLLLFRKRMKMRKVPPLHP
ncbi:uncharacterized protein EV420DRAFT_1486378 [Desarmillaria tabescens]|uniref:Uncharacterized protein n=1 Tax=Armillaria tabescens TaxID=1929756 RepID=A0AA39JAN4_ARMTA|nr:uncharacterized protein EV420DRAFT_1486378 [Desarmillaria tabescens]KAK0439282.1 hypothetical protein EV420DRAFT_1486378 [Desarmillaria tabescens]